MTGGTKPTGKLDHFPRVKEAREALREKALGLLEKYERIIDKAIQEGKLDVAAEHTQWLIEHMPAEDGERVIDSSAAKPKEGKSLPVGPTVHIGIALGGIKPDTLALPPVEVIDVTNDNPSSD